MSAGHVNGVVDPPGSGNGAGPEEPSGPVSLHSSQTAERRPEVAVGAAFVGGFLFALLLRRVRS
jgi:hypothetical protein